jgi:hypothetical protein
VQRTLVIDSRPSGAHVWVNGRKQPGTTPVRVPFAQYGTFDVRLEREGYRSVAREIRLASEIDGYPVVDLPFEIAGGRKTFHRVIDLPPLPAHATPQQVQSVLERATAFRQRARREVAEPGTPKPETPPEILR